MSFYHFIAISFYLFISILCAKILCVNKALWRHFLRESFVCKNTWQKMLCKAKSFKSRKREFCWNLFWFAFILLNVYLKQQNLNRQMVWKTWFLVYSRTVNQLYSLLYFYSLGTQKIRIWLLETVHKWRHKILDILLSLHLLVLNLKYCSHKILDLSQPN